MKAVNKKSIVNDESSIICHRFPHLDQCPCTEESIDLFNNQPLQEIVEGVIVGPVECAYRVNELNSINVTHILNCSTQEQKQQPSAFEYLNIDVQDHESENLSRWFKIACRFIKSAHDLGGRVLIHSKNGQSRCLALLLAQMIQDRKMTHKAAMQFIQDNLSESQIKINDGFVKQLRSWDEYCTNQNGEFTEFE